MSASQTFTPTGKGEVVAGKRCRSEEGSWDACRLKIMNIS